MEEFHTAWQKVVHYQRLVRNRVTGRK